MADDKLSEAVLDPTFEFDGEETAEWLSDEIAKLEAGQRDTYKARITQLVMPEHDDGDNRFFVQKEMDFPFPPYKDLGLILPDLAPYVVFINTVHYDFRTDVFEVTIHARWVEEYDGEEYDWDQTKKSLEDYIDKLDKAGWEVKKKPYD